MAAEKSPRRRSSPLAVARDSVTAWRRITPFFAGSQRKLILLTVASLLAGLGEAALLALVAAAAGALAQGQDSVELRVLGMDLGADVSTLLVIGVGIALLRGGLQVLLAYLPASMSAAAMAGLRRTLFDAFTATAWPVKAAERDGQFQSLMNAHITSASQAVITLGAGISALLMFGTLLASAFVLSLPAAVILSVSSVLLFIGLRPVARRLRRSAKSLSTENIEYSKGVQEVVLMAEETQVFGASDDYRRQFYGLVDQVRAPLLRTRFLAGAVPALYQSVALLMLVLALVAVSFVDTDQIITLGAVVLLLVRALSYGQQIQTTITAIDERLPFMNRLADAIDHYSSTLPTDGPEPVQRIERVGLSDVHYSYEPGKEVLHGISFEARTGEAIGIVGPSGAGKSSVVQVLLRLREPDAGTLRVNGLDGATLRRADWQRRVAYVPQTPQLIWGTVADNIRFYRPDISDADVELAARRAHIHDEITSWPEGYRTVVGQRASAVSGGQRQRLCIARALAAKPDVLILDEPTSALDVRSEELVQQSLEDLKPELVLFLVAHRLSTLAVCDRVMVVVDGRLDAMGTPEQLRETNAFFREVTAITRRQSSD